MVKVLGCLVIFALGVFFGYFIAVTYINQVEPVIVDTPVTLDTLEKQCELTIWTRKGQATFVPIKKPASEIMYQFKGADGVPNGIYTSCYDVKGLKFEGDDVYAITGFMAESEACNGS